MSTVLKLLFGVALTFSIGTALACTEGEKGCQVSSKDWVEYMKTSLPSGSCSAGSPFVKCSDVSQAQCRKIASSALNECLAEHEKSMPLLLNRTEAGEQGEILGDCMGRKLFNAIKMREDKNADCAKLL